MTIFKYNADIQQFLKAKTNAEPWLHIAAVSIRKVHGPKQFQGRTKRSEYSLFGIDLDDMPDDMTTKLYAELDKLKAYDGCDILLYAIYVWDTRKVLEVGTKVEGTTMGLRHRKNGVNRYATDNHTKLDGNSPIVDLLNECMKQK